MELRRLGNESSFSSLFPDEKKLWVGNKYKLRDYRDFSRWYGAPCSSRDNVLYFPDTSYKLRRTASWNQMYREIFRRRETTAAMLNDVTVHFSGCLIYVRESRIQELYNLCG